jgi:DNA topoisomerase-3
MAARKEETEMKLVIAEKPSVANSLAAVLGATTRRDGYLEGGGWLVSWCLGHLAGLADASVYNPDYAKWRYDDLPILPETWRFTISKDKREQFDVLRTLLRREDVTEVVNACDAGREGELIFRTVYCLAGCTKPMKRLWISSMEDSAIREGFANLRPGADYDGLHQAALCRAKADWLVGINATRLFSVLYHRTLNIGRVMSPTLALIVQREAEIDAFKPVPFYTVALELPGFSAASSRMDNKGTAEQLRQASEGGMATVKQVERKDKTEKPPALYDLTTLQRDANRLLGFTAQQTLDYLQNLYEKKLCTYPRTDSRYLTSDMAEGLPVLVNLVANAMPFRKGIAISCNAAVINDKKVTDHHAVIPTRNIREADLSALPVGERAILELVALRLLCAVAPPYTFAETAVVVECDGAEFTAKGRTVKQPGWRALDAAYRASMKNAEPDKEAEDKALPELTEGQELPVTGAAVKEGKTTPPKHFTEDTLLSAMETAGKDDMPEDAERKGLGTPATRAGILEKLVSSGFLERKKSKKTVQLLPSHDAISLITVLPEQLQSPLLTAEWEYRLGEIERGELAPEDFMAEITAMLKELVGTYQVIKGSEYLFAPPREVVGKCPRCGGEIAEMQKGFFCQDQSCKFAIWKNNNWWAAKRKQPTKAIVAALLKDGRAHVTGLYSEKSGKTYDATVVLEDTGQYVNFKLEFDRQKGGGK